MIKYQKKECIGCRICEVICSMEHEKEINCKKSRIRYRDNWPEIGKVEFCRNCAAKACLKACATRAITLSDDDQIKIDHNLCTGCMDCSEACPFGNLPTDGEYPLFCDTCNGSYQCVEWCPTKALTRQVKK